jgi:hypothetical protein
MNLGHDIHYRSAPLRSGWHDRLGAPGGRLSLGPLDESPRRDQTGRQGRRGDPAVSPHRPVCAKATQSAITGRCTCGGRIRRRSESCEAFPSASRRLQDVPPKSTSLVSTVPAVRPGAVW